jgi:hypothetical protein
MNENPTEREYSLLLAALRARLRILAGYLAVHDIDLGQQAMLGRPSKRTAHHDSYSDSVE